MIEAGRLSSIVVAIVVLASGRFAAGEGGFPLLGVGDRVEVQSLGAASPILMLRLEIGVVEPITVAAESFDLDLFIRVEDESGRVLAEDADSGLETNAIARFTPEKTGTVVLLVRVPEGAAGDILVWSVRGAPDVEPPGGAARAAIDYWELALDRARSRSDAARAEMALERLTALGESLPPGERVSAEARRERQKRIDAALEVLSTAETARAEKRLDDARAAVADALRALDGLDDAVAGAALDAVAIVARQVDALEIARRALERALSIRARLVADWHPSRRRALRVLSTCHYDAGGDPRSIVDIEAALVEELERTLPESHADLQEARSNLAVTLFQMGEIDRALELFETVLAKAEGRYPTDHPIVLRHRDSVAAAYHRVGRLKEALALQERILAARERTLPVGHEDLAFSRTEVAATLRDMGRLAELRAFLERTLESLERPSGSDPSDVQASRARLAVALRRANFLAEARAIEEKVLAVWEATLSPDDPLVRSARARLATTLRESNALVAARDLGEKVLASCEAKLPDSAPETLDARVALAETLRAQGNPAGARALLERVSDVYEREKLGATPAALRVREHLALTLLDVGDFFGARAILEMVLSAREKMFSSDHPDVVQTRDWLSRALSGGGEDARALELLRKSLASVERIKSPDSDSVLVARASVATLLIDTGAAEEARAILGSVIETLERSAKDRHVPWLLPARVHLARCLLRLGKPAEARELLETVLASHLKTRPDDRDTADVIRQGLLDAATEQRDWDGVSFYLEESLQGLLARLDTLAVFAAREAQVGAAGMESQICRALSEQPHLPAAAGARVRSAAFALAESRRSLLSVGSAGDPGPHFDAELAAPRNRVLAARRRVADLVAGQEGSEASPGLDPVALTEAALERDRAEAELRRALAGRGRGLVRITAESLGAALPPGSAAVGYLTYHDIEGARHLGSDSVESLLAHVVFPDGRLSRVDLGPAQPIDEAVMGWRRELGASLQRGAARATDGNGGPSAGERLRRLVLDPILMETGEGTGTLFVCLDGALHLVPLDALPLEKGVLGDRLALRVETSFARLVRTGEERADPSEAGPDPGTMLVAGGVNFDAVEGDAGAVEDTRLFAAAAPPVSLSRSGPGGLAFIPLRETRYEADAIADLYENSFHTKPLLLKGEAASKRAFLASAPDARFVHLATHGYFAGESVNSFLDAGHAAEAAVPGMSLAETMTGFSPMALCGLALAGANRGMDSLGRVPGILTAEELAGVDLSGCELAVLSACETNVGLRRAGQGISSLQSALHAAGARTAITSLWKVNDERTRELMVDFYRRIWLEKSPNGKAEALWEAKKALRAKGAPARDWAGWVLTGDPD